MFYSTQKGQFLKRAQKIMGHPAKIKQFSIMLNLKIKLNKNINTVHILPLMFDFCNIIKTNTKHIFYVSTIFQIWLLQC